MLFGTRHRMSFLIFVLQKTKRMWCDTKQRILTLRTFESSNVSFCIETATTYSNVDV